MFWGDKLARALLCGALSVTVGCCYHAQHYGKRRDIGIGEVGCATCKPASASPCHSGCATGGCTTGSCGTPVRTSELAPGNTVMSVSYREPRGMLGRLRDRIDARNGVEFIVPVETVVSTGALAAAPIPLTISNTASREEPEVQSEVMPTSAVTPPLHPMPAEVPIRDTEQK